MNSDNTILSKQKISATQGGGASLDIYGEFGRSCSFIGDLNNDGIINSDDPDVDGDGISDCLDLAGVQCVPTDEDDDTHIHLCQTPKVAGGRGEALRYFI